MNLVSMSAGNSGSKDPVVQMIDAIRQAERDLHAAIEETAAALQVIRQQRLEGLPGTEITALDVARQGREARRQGAAAIARYEQAMREYRSTIVRELVDKHGLSFTEIGKKLDISRQMVARLYGGGEEKRAPEE